MGKFWLFFLGVSLSAHAWASNYSILQGTTSDRETHITIVAKAEEAIGFRAYGDLKTLLPVENRTVAYPGSEHVVHRLKISNLKPNTPYILDVINSQGEVLDRRHFKALNPNATSGRVAVGSCMIRQMHNPFLWNNLARPENRPDLLIILGDLVYLDRASLIWARNPTTGLEVWREFVLARLKENLYFWENLVPTLTVWDDHDAGGDNIDGHHPLISEIRTIYDVFTANDATHGMSQGPGMSKQFQLFGKNFILMDGRSFRDLDPRNPLFGVEQNEFMLKNLRAGPNIILSGTQFFGAAIRKDSLEYNWPQFAKSWTRELREHADEKNASLAFVSGDIHFSEVQDLEPELFGYWTVEITSSNIHSFGLPGHHFLKRSNPRRRMATGTHNIVLMEFLDTDVFEFGVRSMGWRGNDLFKTQVSIVGPLKPAKTGSCEDFLVAAE